MIRSKSARDVAYSPSEENDELQTPAAEAQENADARGGDQEKTVLGPARPFSRLVTTSAVAAALAEVQVAESHVAYERPKRRRLDRRHSGGMEPLVEANTEAGEGQPHNGHRLSAPIVDPSIAGVPNEVVIKPMRLGSASPRGQLKRATSTHLAGIRERLKAAQAGTNAATASTIKRTPSASTTSTLKRTPSSTTPSFRTVAKAVVVSTALTSGGNATTANSERSEQGQNYEQMMARFQLRRLDTTDSGRSLDIDTTASNRRGSTYITPVDSELSQRRMMDDLINSTRPRSEGEQVDSTIGRQKDTLRSSQSHVDSRPEESPRRPGAPSFHSNNASVAPPATASVMPAGTLGTVSGALGSVRSIASIVNNGQSDQDQGRLSQPQEKTDHGHGPQASVGRRTSGGVPALDQHNFQKLTSRGGSRPRPLPRLKKRLRALLTRLRTPMSPFSRTARLRSFVLLVAFCVHTLGFPYEEAFHAGGSAWFLSVDAATEMVFFADFLLAFNTSFVNKRGVLVVSRRHIAWNFLTGAFVFQLLAAVPVMTTSILTNGGAENATQLESGSDAFQRFSHTLIDMAIRSHRIVHILRLLREVGQVRDARIDKSVLGWLLYSRYSHLLRIVWIVGVVMLIAHCVACCWRLLLIDSSVVDSSSIAARTCGAPINPSAELEVYAECFYVAMQMLQGQSLTTHSARENVFASCVNLLGSIVLAVIFGHVAMLVANFNANSTAYQRKMESVFAGMTKMQLPAPLRERIHQYYAHLWREYEALDGAPLERFAKELSHNLTLEVVLFKYMELAMHVPFWENCSPDFQKTLVLSLDTRVYLPDDFIVRRGEVGDEFYMINRGMCELVGSNDTQEHATEPLARRRSAATDHSEHPADTSTLYTTSYDGTIYPDRDDLGHSVHHHGRSARAAARYAHVSPDGFTPMNASVKALTRGQAFGEMALLMNYQRTANVRAMTYVEMCVLSRTAFQAVLTRYPADRKHVISQILISSLENNERFGIPCPLTAMVRSVFAGEVDGVANGDKLITPKRAAKLIAWAVNPDVEDDSIKFALSAKLKDQLVVVRDQEFGVPTHSEGETPRQAATRTGTWTASASASPIGSPRSNRVSSAPVNRKRARDDDAQHDCGCTCHCHDSSAEVSDQVYSRPVKSEPEVESQVMKLESVQAQALALVQELQRGVQDSLYPPSASHQIVAVQGHSDVVATPVNAPNGRRPSITRGASSKAVPSIQQRRSRFVSARSTSAPNFADLDSTAGRAADMKANEEEDKGDDKDKDKVKASQTPPKPIQRAVTARWLKTSESSRALRNPNTFAPLVRPRGAAGSSSQRFIQRVTNQLASLATSNSTASASPTRYADQLFGTVQPSLDAAPSVNETSYRDDSNVSEARY
ncbi:hypothetical protein PF005_g20315 [Phytophthora fragariae]|uniref:Cyclic nucleotide-binding domain-containing protein n=2 Tax=Phytophthora fragariae TaxID=53985 RepID=A0A6A3WR14_9STRA|nr:hypothetical protein PF003_g34526 [Phytophthora fragariae]KAE8929113.1 hypothetical protein PF009_g20766 [Phytophthora fragariae]KAE8977662.1 hypothetical protein PF011_g23563 [Phytophthora fragariae]KAE9088907.1 hypothetical protein PF007_g19796 [Phytophthora fragariae]KAE9095366.1 hypothetical protein PF006_g24032 [Phytophthora fragariae]